MVPVGERLVSSIRLLIVDDHPMIRHALAIVLRREADIGLIVEAGNAAEALALAGQHTIDIAIVDILMPRTSGIRLTSQLHRLQPACRVLAVSAIDDAGLIADMLRAHASGFALKTQPVAEIVHAMHEVLAGRRYLPPSVSRESIDAELAGNAKRPPKRLTAREYEVFDLLICARSTDEIAGELAISRNTVETHRQRIVQKLSADALGKMQRFAAFHGGLIER